MIEIDILIICNINRSEEILMKIFSKHFIKAKIGSSILGYANIKCLPI
jgi:hypothetical protein